MRLSRAVTDLRVASCMGRHHTPWGYNRQPDPEADMAGSHGHHHHGHGHHPHGQAAVAPDMVTDPVCGMQVDPTTSKHRLDHAGTTFHFCSAGCRAKFEAEPEKYL